MSILIDSNFFFAVKAKRDKNHVKSLEILKELKESYKKPKITTYSVVGETLTLAVSRFKGNIHYLDEFYQLFWGKDIFFQIIQLNPEEHKKVHELLKKYCTPKKLLSFIDASLVYMYQKINADYLLSFDSHFDNLLKRMY